MLQSVNAPGACFPGVSQGILIQGGRLLVLSGHVPVDVAGDLVTGDFQTQLTAVFENIGRTLAAAGVGFEAVARFTIYVTDYEPAMLLVLRQVRSKFISAAVPPASALVAVAALYDPRVRVEIDALAVVS
jgi:enamine deaminase RidA (YjgF/YER057c/UK114 family)